MVLVVYMRIHKQQKLSWFWAKALVFQNICCMHIQITILNEHTGINLGVWYHCVVWAYILRDEFTLGHIRWGFKNIFIHVHILQGPKAIYVYSYKRMEELVKAEQMRNIFHLFAACKHKRDFD